MGFGLLERNGSLFLRRKGLRVLRAQKKRPDGEAMIAMGKTIVKGLHWVFGPIY